MTPPEKRVAAEVQDTELWDERECAEHTRRVQEFLDALSDLSRRTGVVIHASEWGIVGVGDPYDNGCPDPTAPRDGHYVVQRRRLGINRNEYRWPFEDLHWRANPPGLVPAELDRPGLDEAPSVLVHADELDAAHGEAVEERRHRI